MADNKDNKDFHDRDRVNMNEPYEVTYWSKKFGIDKADLEKAVQTVGPMVKDIEAFLKGEI